MMSKRLSIILMLSICVLAACSEKEQQQASQELSHQPELEKAKQVQPTINEGVEKNREEIEKENK